MFEEFDTYLNNMSEDLLDELCTSDKRNEIYELAIKRVLLNKILTKWNKLVEE